MSRKRQRPSTSPHEPPSDTRRAHPSSAEGLRLTRSKACTECKTQKTKCETRPDDTSCIRCLRHGLECVSYDVAHQFLQSDAAWKKKKTEEVDLLRAAVQHLLKHTRQPELTTFQTRDSPRSHIEPENPDLAIGMSRENSPQVQQDDPSSFLAAPMRNLYELTRLKHLRNTAGSRPDTSIVDEDFISQGAVSVEVAESLFTQFKSSNNLMLWDGLLLVHDTLESVRRSSTLLTASILTVSALHTPGQTDVFHHCYTVFVSLASNLALSRHSSLDDVRALLISAFYLANLSWKLSGLATRIAAELGLHQSYHQLVQGDSTKMEHVRLWYATYVCDRQFSIAHGRPPAAVNDESISNYERFLAHREANDGDIRLVAQVSLFKLLTEAYMEFGNDSNRPLDQQDTERLRTFNKSLAQWYDEWGTRLKSCPHLETYPSEALRLYYHFAEFQLNSLALRGITPLGTASGLDNVSMGHNHAVCEAITAATDTLALASTNQDLRRVFPKVPIFTYTMVAFCATFLLKMAATWGRARASVYQQRPNYRIGIVEDILGKLAYIMFLVKHWSGTLVTASSTLNEKHLARHIAAGMREMLEKFDALDELVYEVSNPIPRDDLHMALPQDESDANLVSTGEYNFYDLGGTLGFGLDETLLGQMAADSFDLWLQ
ncbi:hypothetical protein BO71DRAFT_363081, partial [Aspergillus ellipticus CBS 707.79]